MKRILLIGAILAAAALAFSGASFEVFVSEAALVFGSALASAGGMVLAAIAALLLLVWVLSRVRIPARAVAPISQSVPAPARRESIRRPSIIGVLVGAVLKVILCLTVFMTLGSAEEFLLSENRRLYPQPDAWWWDHSPPSPMESLASAGAFLVVSFLIVVVLNIRAHGQDRGARSVVMGVTVFYVISTLILKFIT